MEDKDFNLKIQFIALEKTVKESINLINWGLNFSEQVTFANANQFYTLYFLNTSLGFELLMKSMLCYKEYRDKESFNIDLKYYSHNLLSLKKEILKNYESLSPGTNFQEKRIFSKLKGDRIFISGDKDFLRVLEILSSYAQGGRFYKLDFVTSKLSENQKSPEGQMEAIILDILDKTDVGLRDKFINTTTDSETKIWQEVIKKYITPVLKNFLEALTRQFAYGCLGKEARLVVSKYPDIFPGY